MLERFSRRHVGKLESTGTVSQAVMDPVKKGKGERGIIKIISSKITGYTNDNENKIILGEYFSKVLKSE